MQKLKLLISSAWKNITVEPVVFLYFLSQGLILVIRPNLLLDKACNIKLNYTAEICNNLTGNYLIEAQKVVTDYERIYNIASSGPRILYVLFAGPWSDKNGRKLLLLLPVIGHISL